MPKIDENGREYIEQDGKRYYKNMWGNWEAEKDFWGNDKVETDFFGNPKINTDFLGNQKIETDWLGKPYVEPEKKDDNNCYLTTACIRALGSEFDDDCCELTLLRKFRDTYVKENHPEAIEEYYSIAPTIVSKIQSRENSRDLFMKIYQELVKGTIELLEKKQEEDAYNLYRNYSLRLVKDIC